MWDNYKEVSIGKVEAYKQLKENVNYLLVRHYGIKKLESQIGKVSATQMIENAKMLPDYISAVKHYNVAKPLMSPS